MSRLNQSMAILVDTEEEEDHPTISPQLLRQYNSQYNLIYAQIHKFLEQCKQSVQRFVALHNFGVGFNLSALLGSLTQVEKVFNHSMDDKQKSVDPRSAAKHKYEVTFNQLVLRMSTLLTDIFDCEQEFKQNFFGQQKAKQKRKPLAMLSPRSSLKSISKRSVGSAKLKTDPKQDEEHETVLRTTLNKQLKPQIKINRQECKPNNTTTDNLFRLNSKVDATVQHMKATRERETKLIELFNMNRLKPQPIPEPPPAASTAISNNSDQDQMDQQLEQGCRFARKENNNSFSELRLFNDQGPNFKKAGYVPLETAR